MNGETEAGVRLDINLSLKSSLRITQVIENPPHQIPGALTFQNDKNREPNPYFQLLTTKHTEARLPVSSPHMAT